MDSKFRADHTTHTASGTLTAIARGDKMVSFAIGLCGCVENMYLAELYTEATPLTPLRYHVNLIMSCLYFALAQSSPLSFARHFS